MTIALVNMTGAHYSERNQAKETTMTENVGTTLELKESQLEFLDAMVKKYDLPDRSKALRCLITFAMQEPTHETSVFTVIRCENC